ncbi:MAG: hypothetical protein U9Q84_06610, partial [Thermodesulfobacteriota bacterium]|nr:hypothetical protein [Thermodesulfobacteriota bacterium]
FIVVIFCLLLSFSAHAGNFPVFGRDQVEGTCLLEDHSEALLRWSRQGVENAVLINIDAHDDLRWIAPEKIETLKRLVQKKDWKSIEMSDSGGDDGLYHPGSFIYAACKLGMISRVYWVIPFSYFQVPEVTKALNRFLAAYGFDKRSINTFSLHNGCYQGVCEGISLTICGVENLPQIDEPVILSIDADFFPPFAHWYGRDILTAMSEFFFEIAQKQYRIRDAFVACSVNGGFLSANRRWIAGHCMEILEQPQRISGPYPEEWLVHNLADTYYVGGSADALLDLTRRFNRRYPQDLCLMSYRVFALQATGNNRDAYELACTLGSIDKRYAFILADLGQGLIDQGNLDAALPCFRAAYQSNPHMNFRQKNLGDALMAAGKYGQAIYYYDIYRQKNGPFPVAFAMGSAACKLGDDFQARTWFEQGVVSLKHVRYQSDFSEIDVTAIRHAATFFRQKKLPDTARIITSHPYLQNVFEQSGNGT